DDAARRRAALRSEQQGLRERAPSRAVNRAEAGLAIRADRREQRDAVRWVGHVKVDARDVGHAAAIFVALKKEARAVVITRRRSAEAMLENKVGVLVRLGACALDRLRRRVV